MKEKLEDIQAFDRTIAEGGNGLPQAYILRLIDGECPMKDFRQWRNLSQSALARA